MRRYSFRTSAIRTVILIAMFVALLSFFNASPAHAADGLDDSTQGILKLTNYTSNDAIVLLGDTTIILEGKNTLTACEPFSIDAAGAKITIKGSGSLDYAGVIICDELVLEQCTLNTIRTGNPEKMPAIDSRSIKISGATLNADVNYDAALGWFNSNLLSQGFCKSIEITNRSNVYVNAFCGLLADNLIVDNSVLIAKANKIGFNPGILDIIPSGLMVKNAVFRNKASVTASGYGIAVSGFNSITIDNSTVTADANVFYAIPAFPPSAIAVMDYTNPSGPVPGTITLKNVSVQEPAGYDIDLMSYSPNGEEYAKYRVIGKNGTPASHVVIKQHEHKWDAGKVTKAPTMSAAGVMTYTCQGCGETKTEVIAKLSSPDNLKPGADAGIAEAAILALPNDNDPAGSSFGLLQLKAAKTTKNSIKLTWKKAPGAKKYIIYANACGKGKKYQKLTTATGTSKTIKKVAGAKLKKGKYYKFLMIAVDANNKVISTSTTVHVATLGGKVGNDKKVMTKAKKNKATVKVKKTFKLAAKTLPANKKLKVKKHRTISYETSNAKVATVSKKGIIKGVKKGKCKIYAYAQNGVCVTIKVTVK